MKADGYRFSRRTPIQSQKQVPDAKSLLEQLSLTPVPIAHVHAQELMPISALVDRLPEAVALVHEDLSLRFGRRIDPTKGRDGMAAEQLLRVAILKQQTGLSYERLAFALADSSTYRSFCREKINQMVVRQARDLGVEKGTKVRTDCLVVDSNIHHPTDSSLLWDCVRVLVRIMKRAQAAFGFEFVSQRAVATGDRELTAEAPNALDELGAKTRPTNATR